MASRKELRPHRLLYQSGVTRVCHVRAHGQTADMDAGTAGAVRRAGSRDVGQLGEIFVANLVGTPTGTHGVEPLDAEGSMTRRIV